MGSVYSIFEDLSVPHEAEIGPGPAPGIKMPVRVLTSIKQEILDDADYPGTGVVEGRHKSEEVEEAIEEDVTENVEMAHLTVIVGPQQLAPENCAEENGGEAEEDEDQLVDQQYWQRMFDNLQGQYHFASLLTHAHFPVLQQSMPPMPAHMPLSVSVPKY
ncbi:unnamed protein product [Caenorhabditis nigoni]